MPVVGRAVPDSRKPSLRDIKHKASPARSAYPDGATRGLKIMPRVSFIGACFGTTERIGVAGRANLEGTRHKKQYPWPQPPVIEGPRILGKEALIPCQSRDSALLRRIEGEVDSSPLFFCNLFLFIYFFALLHLFFKEKAVDFRQSP